MIRIGITGFIIAAPALLISQSAAAADGGRSAPYKTDAIMIHYQLQSRWHEFIGGWRGRYLRADYQQFPALEAELINQVENYIEYRPQGAGIGAGLFARRKIYVVFMTCPAETNRQRVNRFKNPLHFDNQTTMIGRYDNSAFMCDGSSDD